MVERSQIFYKRMYLCVYTAVNLRNHFLLCWSMNKLSRCFTCFKSHLFFFCKEHNYQRFQSYPICTALFFQWCFFHTPRYKKWIWWSSFKNRQACCGYYVLPPSVETTGYSPYIHLQYWIENVRMQQTYFSLFWYTVWKENFSTFWFDNGNPKPY
jgi:hypothetical protein